MISQERNKDDPGWNTVIQEPFYALYDTQLKLGEAFRGDGKLKC